MAVDVGAIVARLVLDRSDFTDSLAAARSEAAAFKDIKIRLSLDTSGFYAEWARVKAMMADLGGVRGVNIPVRYSADSSGLALAGGAINKRVDVYYHASGDGGGGGGAGGLLSSLFWGGGSRIPLLGTLAGLGSLASFAGLGPEHVIMTLAGLAGSAAGGILGGGLLAAGNLGVAGVGMGTDLAGIGQAAGDIKTVYGDMNALNQAIALYGKTSTQAALAQKQLNYDLAGFSPVARSAVVQAATTATAFKSIFDLWTGPAEQIGAQIINQGMKVGEAFLPTIGESAAENMQIIQQWLQPLFDWMQTQGLPIFQHLENMFTLRLPMAMSIFDNGLEIILKTINVAADYTGGFEAKLDAFLIRLNTPTGFAAWSKEIGKLIGDFHLWMGLIEAVGRDIYYLFHNDAGTASSIVSSLTEMLTKFGDWEKSTSGSTQLHSLFEIHKQEIEQLLQLLPPLLSSLGHVYLGVAPALTGAFITVMKALNPLLEALSKNPVGAWALGLTILAGKLGLLKDALAPLGAAAFGGIVGGLKGIAASTGIINAEGDLGLMGLAKSAGILGAAVASYFGTRTLLDYIFGKPANAKPQYSLTPQAQAFIKQYDSMISAVQEHALHENLSPAIALTAPPPKGWEKVWLGVQTFFGNLWHDINNATFGAWTSTESWLDGVWQTIDRNSRHWFGDTQAYIAGTWHNLYEAVVQIGSDIYASADGIWQHMDTDARHWWGNMEQFFIGLWGGIERDASHWGSNIYSILDSAWQHLDTDARHWWGSIAENVIGGFFAGILKQMAGVGDWINTNVVQPVIHAVKNFFGIKSPSTVMMGLGLNVMEGFIAGLLKSNPLNVVKTVFGSVANGAKEIFSSLGGDATSILGALGGSGLNIGLSGPSLGSLAGLPAGGVSLSNAQIGQYMAAQMGWTGAQWQALNAVAMRESGWSTSAFNNTSGAYGIAQFIQGAPEYAMYGGNAGTAVGQITAFLNYIKARYGTPEAAWAHELAAGWYAGGTPFAPGGLAVVGEQGPELINLPRGSQVFTNRQSQQMVGGVTFNAGSHNISISVGSGDPTAIEVAVCRALDKHDRDMLDTITQLAGATFS